ncbi:hypothetical protein BHE74_00000941 [Ensete ventricosum]|nr:hypothetical protein GW17_00036979 [Ensete ventricosum]RWW89963.1 hypothetical protein BHE74_00000941 [Ensete ventricosum]
MQPRLTLLTYGIIGKKEKLRIRIEKRALKREVISPQAWLPKLDLLRTVDTTLLSMKKKKVEFQKLCDANWPRHIEARKHRILAQKGISLNSQVSGSHYYWILEKSEKQNSNYLGWAINPLSENRTTANNTSANDRAGSQQCTTRPTPQP